MGDSIKRADAIDIIYREDAIKAINLRARIPHDVASAHYASMAINAIRSVPSADRPQGEWVPFEYGDERWHKCTACGVADKYIEYVERPNGTTGKLVAIRNYCPNCGADMRPKLQGTHFDSIIIDECAMKGREGEECGECFGASFNDCDECRKLVPDPDRQRTQEVRDGEILREEE